MLEEFLFQKADGNGTDARLASCWFRLCACQIPLPPAQGAARCVCLRWGRPASPSLAWGSAGLSEKCWGWNPGWHLSPVR